MTLTQLPPVVGSFFKKNRVLQGIVEAIIFPYNEDTEKGERSGNMKKLVLLVLTMTMILGCTAQTFAATLTPYEEQVSTDNYLCGATFMLEKTSDDAARCGGLPRLWHPVGVGAGQQSGDRLHRRVDPDRQAPADG